ncbi:hypothetical protein ACFPPA_05720 [Rhodanobacter ginsengisoli]|uniref:Uncharacterized protein n=1 Tax=Rhodanobacter ginsengisoli TaxID=418646 RepID=A0ABW0QNU2_9GAMM
MKAGELILTTCDEYADKSNLWLMRVLKDGDLQALAKQFDTEWKWLPGSPSAHYAFGAWLVEHGWVEYVSYSERHLGSYGELEPDDA